MSVALGAVSTGPGHSYLSGGAAAVICLGIAVALIISGKKGPK